MTDQLPTPRLELRWREATPEDNVRFTNKTVCDYSLVLAPDLADVRYIEPLDGIYFEMGKTGSTASMASHIAHGKISPPFRDGVHIRRDARVLKLPAFIRHGDRIEQIEFNNEQ